MELPCQIMWVWPMVAVIQVVVPVAEGERVLLIGGQRVRCPAPRQGSATSRFQPPGMVRVTAVRLVMGMPWSVMRPSTPNENWWERPAAGT